MEIIIGKTAGFCYGVKRAIEGARKEIEETNGIVYCLGEIVHNRQVVEELESKGLKFIENLKEGKNKIIIRAHGVEKKVYDIAKEQKIELKDYTCPNVLKIHRIAEQYANNGYYIFLCGSRTHPENIGTLSYCGKNVYVIEKEDDVIKALSEFKKANVNKVLLISQTTYSLEKFYIIEEIIKNELFTNIEVVIKNTICKATELRQKETEEISKRVDYMIIIGGVNSSNTKKLYDIAKTNCGNCICVETVKQLNLEELKKYEKIGIMAGASTPQESIEEIIGKIKWKVEI